MRLGILSDVHLNTASMRAEFLSEMRAIVSEQDIGLLVLAGDITPGAGQTICYVRELIEVLGIQVYYVPGNHELWNRFNGLETSAIYELFLADPNCLVGQAVSLDGGYKLLGDIHWYDYSYANHERFTQAQFEKKMLRGSRWQDAYYVNWGKSDREITDEFLAKEASRLASLQGQGIIYISHMINHPRLAVPDQRFELWGFFNAYLGSKRLHELILETAPVYAICGHVHHRVCFEEDETTYICACLGYPREWKYLAKGERNMAAQIREAMVIIDLYR